MFDLGWAELFVIAVVALIVIGPRDLPKTMRIVASWFRKARSLAREFQSGMEDLAREAELDDVKSEIKKMVDYNPGADLEASLDPDGELKNALPSMADLDDMMDEQEEGADFGAAKATAGELGASDGDAAGDDKAAAQGAAAGDQDGADAQDDEDQEPDGAADTDRDEAAETEPAPTGTVIGPAPATAKAGEGRG
jgi:sec-independent protein translocase protein TatB